MKKLGKKLSFLTKIMLVVGLLISNLSSLTVVFADEMTMDIAVVNDKLNVKYLGELAEEVEEVQVNVYENYTYFDATFESEVVNNYILTSEELEMLVSSEDGLVIDSILSSIVFDGTYNAKIEIVDVTDETVTEPVVIDSREFSMEVLHESGLKLSVINVATNEVIEPLENGVYPVSLSGANIKIVAKILAGGLNPTDMFMYEDVEYMASELLADLSFSSEFDLTGRLFGEYSVPVAVTVLNAKTLEDVVYADNVNVLFESYELNAHVLNTATASPEVSLDDSYVFVSDTKDGVVYVLLDETKTNTMLDLYKIANFVLEEDEIITYLLSNGEYEDILTSYDVETAGVTLEEYLETIVLDDTCVLSLSNDGLTVTYKVVVIGDLNNDKILTEDDLLELVNQVVGEKEVTVEKSDLYKLDGKVDTLDVMYLDQVVKEKTWDVILTEEQATLEARLDVNEDDIVSGDEFTVSYVLTLSDYAVSGVSGLFKYDDTMLELVSINTNNEWLGNNKNGQFLYLGSESLTGTVTTDETGAEVVTPTEYVVVTATFKALQAGTSTVTVENPEYFNQASYLVLEEMEIVTDVIVNVSDNNNLSSLIVAGQTIVLEEDVLDYEITVSNDVVAADIEAVVENVAARVTSIVCPEELVEGTNTITITVTSESGDVKVYTVTVTREESPEEENVTTQVNYNNYYNDYEEDDDVEVVTPEVETPEETVQPEEEKESNLSRVIIIILILLVIAGLIYLIFKDDEDEETKKANKEINKLKKEVKEPEIKAVSKTVNKPKTNNNANKNNSKNKNSTNKKKER